MSIRVKREIIKKYLSLMRKVDVALPITREEMHRVRWELARDKQKNISLVEYIGICDCLEDLHKKGFSF